MAGGIELDHQVLLDTPVAGFLLPVSYFRFPTSRTHCERISERIANACSITKCCCWIPWWPSLVECSQAIELPRAAGGIELSRDLLLDTPVAVVLLPLSYFRFPTSQTHCERISERIANA